MAELWTGDTQVRLQRRDVLVIPPGVRHSPGELHCITARSMPEPSRLLWLGSFPYGVVINLCESEGRRHRSTTRQLFLERRCRAAISDLVYELRGRQPHHQLMAASLLVQALLSVCRGVNVTEADSALAGAADAVEEAESLCGRARRFIRQQFDAHLDLDAIARAAMSNRSTLCREFKQAVGMTVMDYLTSVRIDAARRLLLTSLKVSEVSRLVGFEDPYHFSRVFRRLCGCSPKEFRSQPPGGG
jgi:AraC-like DNA-binding protein